MPSLRGSAKLNGSTKAQECYHNIVLKGLSGPALRRTQLFFCPKKHGYRQAPWTQHSDYFISLFTKTLESCWTASASETGIEKFRIGHMSYCYTRDSTRR